MTKIEILDSSLRDGAQGEGISYTLHDKLTIAQELDRLTVDYIEAGNPFSNPKDMEFFEAAGALGLRHARLVAFGSTCRKGLPAAKDPNLRALLDAGTEVVSVFGKASVLHVTEVLGTTREENLRMIADSVSFLAAQGREVFFDAEHFFDGYRTEPDYALRCLRAARDAGASVLVLCDTNGGTFPDETAAVIGAVRAALPDVRLSIHCHNDNGCAAANTILAVKAGCTQIQGTYLGVGERCGNACLASVIPSLQLKLGYACIEERCLPRLTKAARLIAEVSNLTLDRSLPYVGDSAFSHKGGMHVDGVCKNAATFEHVSPESVGNHRNLLVSEVAGRAAMLPLIREIDPTVTKDSPEAKELTELLKEFENRGYLFESAGASLELLITKKLGRFHPFFRLRRFKVIGEQGVEGAPVPGGNAGLATAVINIQVGDRTEISAAEGDGPVHALDLALRDAVSRFYPSVERLRLTDYKVRVMDSTSATAASVRVLITTTDGEDIWTTVGVSRDIIEASMAALMDSIEYRLMKKAHPEAGQD